MGQGSAIEWTDTTWNPIVGCTIVSPGCTNCYAMKLAGRRLKNTPKYSGLTKDSKAGPIWTGEVRLWEKALEDPLRWKKPQKIFVNSEGDLFHESIPDEWIDRVFAVMASCLAFKIGHEFQILTKRAARMREYLCRERGALCRRWARAALKIGAFVPMLGSEQSPDARESNEEFFEAYLVDAHWPLPNCWLGVSTERQEEADERIPLLLQTPAAVRFISAEPLIGPIDLVAIARQRDWPDRMLPDWVIVGGESGKNARPMHPQWARDIRDQCVAASVPFFFKQWGEYTAEILPGVQRYTRVGKKKAGRLLDGREWNEFPNPTALKNEAA